MGSRHEPNILELERATGRPRICFANPHRLQWHTEIRGSVGAKQAESTIPEIFLAPWSGQRDVCVFASQIRTGCGRLSATLPARYKRFAFI